MKCELCDNESIACSSAWLNDEAMKVLYWCAEHAPDDAEYFIPSPEFDDDGYPTEETLKIIREWEYSKSSKWTDLMAYVGKAWHWDDFVTVNSIKNFIDDPVWEYRCVTGGWSGNEEIIGALQDNFIFWSMCWRESHRSGKYIFEVKK